MAEVRTGVEAARFDEVHGPDGATRSHWKPIESTLLAADRATLLRAQDRLRRLRRSQGTVVAASVGGPGPLRPLDPVPYVVAAADWRRLEAGLDQRARLLDRLLADVYGAGTLLGSGLLPAEVVYAPEGFLRPCRGWSPPGKGSGPGPLGRWLVAGAVDVVRRPGGEFAVRGDRTSVARGLGGTLSARQVLSVLHPELYRRLRVRRVDGFYDTLRSTLASLAPEPLDADNARTAILSPGPAAEAFPEHTFLARSLGFTLVSGPDLTVRDGRVWLRSVGGLEGVDVLLRLVDDAWCDPLELRAGSRLGPPGLLEASRRGTVALANPLGAGFLENPGLAPFLPALSRALLGEELLLEPVPAWWCGDPAARSHVLAHLDGLVLRPLGAGGVPASPAFGVAPGTRIVTADLDAEAREQLRGLVEAHPNLWVGEERLEGASAPVIHDGRVEPARVVLRCFVVAAGDGYQVMPGGLARARLEPLPAEGGGSAPAVIVRKDAWVQAEGPRRLGAPVLTLHQIDLGASLPSRNAEALYWMGRHAEAAETAIRLVQTIASELGETPELATDAGGAWVAIFAACLGWTAEPARTPPGGAPKRRRPPVAGPVPPILRRALVDEKLPRSLVRSLSELLAASLSARELLSTHTCQVLATLEDRLGALRAMSGPEGLEELAGSILTSLMALVGLSTESMVRDPGWLFMDIGRRMERARLLVRVLGEALVPVPDPDVAGLVHETLLACCESLVAYRRRYRSDIEVGAMANILLVDPTNPRSLGYQADRLLGDLRRLPGRQGAAVEAVGATLGTLLTTDVSSLLEPLRGKRSRLRGWLGEVAAELDRVAEAVNLTYFAHVPVQTVTMAAAKQ